MVDEPLVFNGIDGRSGEYLFPPLSPDDFWQLARRQTRWAGQRAQDLDQLTRSRNARVMHGAAAGGAAAGAPAHSAPVGPAQDLLEQPPEDTHPAKTGRVALEGSLNMAGVPVKLEMTVSYRDPTHLDEVGWGLVFPQAADPAQVEQILDALQPLLARRQTQAKGLFKIFYRPETKVGPWDTQPGFAPGDTRDTFLQRLKTGAPGPVDPVVSGVPYYLLIVADPGSIPYEFQFALDTQYAVGRIYFDQLSDFARYAASVVSAETDPGLRLKRQAAFFGPAHPNDPATQLSSSGLIAPLVGHIASVASGPLANWKANAFSPANSTKANLAGLLSGQAAAPALLFTASHGMGWPNGDPRQFDCQGALLCQNWRGPGSGMVPEDAYFSARDVPSDANLLGMIVFNFACYGAGTPQWDYFTQAGTGFAHRLAPRSFMAGLPGCLLSLERGGALAVIGHVERAWGCSIQWADTGPQTEAFKSVLYSLMKGKPVGLALEDMNARYVEIAAQLSEQLQAGQADVKQLAYLWTANNDARSYALTGDPAVCLPQAEGDPNLRPQTHPLEIAGELPPVLAPPPAATGGAPGSFEGGSPPPLPPQGAGPAPAPATPYTLLDGLAAMEATSAALQAQGSYDIGDDIRTAVAQLRETFTHLSQRLSDFASEVTTLKVKTYTVEGLNSTGDDLDSKLINKDASLKARMHACTHISLGGDVELFLPADLNDADLARLPVHADLTAQAMANRAELIKAVVGALAELIGPK